MFLSGVPANLPRRMSDQWIENPQFAGSRGVMGIFLAARIFVHEPSDPKLGQEAPPSARSVGPVILPFHVSRSLNSTPSFSKRASHARSRGEAFTDLGNTRPLVPINISCPRPSHHSMSFCGGKFLMSGVRCCSALP